MKILLANKFFFLKGGSERVFFQERDYLLEHNHNIFDFSMKDERNFSSHFSPFFVPNIDYNNNTGVWEKIKQVIFFVHSFRAVKNVKRIIEQEKPEKAHLQNIYDQLTPSIIPVLKKYGIKIVMSLHDYKLICPSYLALKRNRICTDCEGKHFLKPLTENCQNSFKQELLLSVEALWHKWRKSYDNVDYFIAPSQFLANLVSKRIPAEKIEVLHNGIDVTKYQPHYRDKGYGLYLGRLSKEKGIETLLKAHGISKSAIALRVVGTGPLEKELRKLNPNVMFLGYKTGQALNELIANAAFVIVPSEWHENCSMVVLEAMAFGKPVIGSNVGGIPEQIENEETGFLFRMGNVVELARKIDILSKNRELRKIMGSKARKKIEMDYLLERHCNQLINIYQNLLSGV